MTLSILTLALKVTIITVQNLIQQAGNTKRASSDCTVDLLFDWFGISCMTTDNFCFYLQNRLIQSSQTGG